MRIAIISDIHSNFIALQAVIADIDQNEDKIDKIVCLGDVIGYGPAPNECVHLIKERSSFCLMGNHDHAIIGKENLAYFNPFAKEAVLWSQKQLSEETIEFLEHLPFEKVENHCTYVHSSPLEPKEWTYVLSKNDAHIQFQYLSTQLCFIGHTHVAGIFRQKNNSINYLLERKINIKEDEKYIINVGSVGQPRDFDPRSSYGILDLQKQLVEYRRIPYDIETTQVNMEKFGLPQYLIDRLSYGR
jgi:predicted phosphodiesterase